MLQPKFESYDYTISYPVYSTYLTSTYMSKALQDESDLALQLPYGTDTNVWAAGMIGQFVNDSGSTSITLTDGTAPSLILADNFIDCLRSGYVSAYPLQRGSCFIVSGCYDKGKVYSVNTLLVAIPSGTNQGKLTPALYYNTEPIVAVVIEAPSDPANDSAMTIMTLPPVVNPDITA